MRIRDIDLYVEDQGSGPPILFSHGLLWSGRMFAPQVAALRDRFRCITYDHRGQGRSEMPPERTIDMETVYEDAVALIDALGIAPCHFVGLSMGGFVGMRLAARRPELVRSLVLLETAADPEPRAGLPKYTVLNALARLGLLSLITPLVLPVFFGPSFLENRDREDERRRATEDLRTQRRRVYRAVRGVLGRKGIEHELGRIQCPTLVLRGDEDRAIALERAVALHRGIAGSTFVRLPRGGHTVTLEEPDLVNAELVRFLDGVESAGSGRAAGSS